MQQLLSAAGAALSLTLGFGVGWPVPPCSRQHLSSTMLVDTEASEIILPAAACRGPEAHGHGRS